MHRLVSILSGGPRQVLATPGRLVVAGTLALTCGGASAFAQDFVVQPYLQQVTPSGARVLWESSDTSPSEVAWGLEGALDRVATGTAVTGPGTAMLHTAALAPLEPDTRYGYRVRVGTEFRDGVFRTPPAPGEPARFRFVAMSDMQRDDSHPEQFRVVVEDGVVAWLEALGEGDIADTLAATLAAGDLVDDGNAYGEWAHDFFGPGARLFANAPVYPVLGNHENNSPLYFRYFDLPDNGDPALREQWWALDYANVRLLGLNSNEIAALLPQQMTWLDGVLDATCDDPNIDFVVAQLHHPHHSELWPAGNAGFTGRVIDRLGAFTTRCNKTSVHLYGHTHGYSRGQSRDHGHLMVNVASGGGALDRWGGTRQSDYPEATVSHDDYGFVVLEVEAGDAPSMTVSRYSMGTPEAPLDRELRDRVTVRRNNVAPTSPAPSGPIGREVAAECATLRAEGYVDPDGDAFQSAHWQVARDCAFEDLVTESWVQSENWWFGEDLNATVDLTETALEQLPAGEMLCWRVRYRDEGLAWSAWSAPTVIETQAAAAGDERLRNGDGEELMVRWEGGAAGVVARGCDSPDVVAGRRILRVGEGCGDAGPEAGWQSVDLASDTAWVRVAATTAAVVGSRAEVAVLFVDADGTVLDEQPVVVSEQTRWNRGVAWVARPPGATQARVELRTSAGGGAFFDDVSLREGAGPQPDCAARGDGAVLPPPEPPVVDPEPEPGPERDDVDAGDGDAADDADVAPDAPAEDAVAEAGADAAIPDIGAGDDAAASDTGAADAGEVRESGGARSCAASRGATSPWWAAVALAALVVVSRRRRRS